MASYGKEIDDLLAMPYGTFMQALAGYVWRTTPSDLRNGISLEDFTQRVAANPLAGLRYYSTVDYGMEGIARKPK